jgi:hypothetical protein
MTPFNDNTLLLWSIPLLIALGIVLRLGKSSSGGRPCLLAQWAALTGGQRVTVLLVLAGLVSMLVVGDHLTTAPRKQLLRDLFHVPEETALDHFSTQKKMSIRYRAEGIFRFSDEGWQAYATNRDNPVTWTAPTFDYGGTTFNLAGSSAAFRWHKLPYPHWAGGVTTRWSSNAMDPAQYVRNGHYLCAAILRQGTANDPKATYTARTCRDLPPDTYDTVAALLLGVTDDDTKTLYATIY